MIIRSHYEEVSEVQERGKTKGQHLDVGIQDRVWSKHILYVSLYAVLDSFFGGLVVTFSVTWCLIQFEHWCDDVSYAIVSFLIPNP